MSTKITKILLNINNKGQLKVDFNRKKLVKTQKSNI